jgi:hypothetical protein
MLLNSRKLSKLKKQREKQRENIDSSNENLLLSDLSDVIWLEKLKKDLLQNKYNLNKVGLYNGLIKEGIENLFKSLKDEINNNYNNKNNELKKTKQAEKAETGHRKQGLRKTNGIEARKINKQIK